MELLFKLSKCYDTEEKNVYLFNMLNKFFVLLILGMLAYFSFSIII